MNKRTLIVNDVFVGEVDNNTISPPALSAAAMGVTAGVKHDAGKPALHLLPVEALEEIAQVLSYGEKKYNSWNWAQGFKWSRLYGATLRHLYAHMRGENKDPETGLSHLAHVGCNILFLLYHEMHKIGVDDRHVRPTSFNERMDK